MKLNVMLKSQNTTRMAILLFISAVVTGLIAVLDNDPETILNVETLILAVTQLFGAFGFLAARDADKT